MVFYLVHCADVSDASGDAAIRFNAIMSSWRGVRFGFNGELLDAYKTVLLWPLFGLVTLVWVCPMLGINRISTYNHWLKAARPQRRLLRRPKIFIEYFLLYLVSASVADYSVRHCLMLSESVVALIIAGAGYLALYVLIYAAFQSTYFAAVFNNVYKGNRLQTDVTITGYLRSYCRTPFLPS